MSLVKVDVENLRTMSKDIMDLSVKYNNLVDKFYKRINGINSKTFEWTGSDSEYFVNFINKEKPIYDTIGKVLRDYSLELDKITKTIDDLIKLNTM